MAEIKIEKKKPSWIWIVLALIILGALVYMVMITSSMDSDQEVLPLERDTIDIGMDDLSVETDFIYSMT